MTEEKTRVEVRLLSADVKKLYRIARERSRTINDVLRVLVVEEHARLVASRGETGSSVDSTKREA